LAQWTRSYLYPAIDSLNRPKPEAGEFQDDLTDVNCQSLLDLAIEDQEISHRMTQRSALQIILDRAVKDLSPELQEILQLCYRDRLSQRELSDRLQLSQPTISRRIKQAEAELLTTLLKWTESQLNKFPDPNELKVISAALKEWLTEYCGTAPNSANGVAGGGH
jgi:DNA-directed RNA polymerase specialized sigma24 family protein